MSRTPVLPGDLQAGRMRLKLSAIRHQDADILLTAKTQRWAPEETLRALVELEIAARDQSNCRNRMTAARLICTGEPRYRTARENDAGARVSEPLRTPRRGAAGGRRSGRSTSRQRTRCPQ